eukprot:TRINITY_DN2561_c0_g2_i1.p1 TRINITY_DN2561_c0_g2~~TRINITY_DN2561_c0_g2_i1.p1  ORF type:complete len:160 (+),score=29.54 TRINITY_DN2561_c0_g2_i1:190-669(+)
MDIPCLQTYVEPISQNVPVIFTEIGEMDCKSTFVEPLMSWADTVGISYLAWAWNVADCCTFPGLLLDYQGTPTNFGIGFMNHMNGTALSGKTNAPPSEFCYDDPSTTATQTGSSEALGTTDGGQRGTDPHSSDDSSAASSVYYTLFACIISAIALVSAL